MPIQSYKMGPGTMKFGAGLAVDASCQIKSGKLDWSENTTTTDPVDVLCGEQIPAETTATYTAQLTLTVVQDLAAAGFVAWSWTNKGLEVPFEFIPATAAARKITGTVRVVPIGIGGDPKVRNVSDVTFQCIGTPILANTP